MNVLVRRTTTVLAVAVALVIGALSIEAAAAAVRDSAPPAGPAVTVQSIQAELELERARSEALQEQLQRLTIQSTTLAENMAVADEQISLRRRDRRCPPRRPGQGQASAGQAPAPDGRGRAGAADRRRRQTASRSGGGEDRGEQEAEEPEEEDD